MGWPKRPVIVHVVHSLEGGGTERLLVSLLRSFDHRQFKHVVVTLREAGSLAANLPDEIACIALGTVGPSRWSGLRLAKAIAGLRPSVLHARNVCTWFDALLSHVLTRGSKLVLGFHGLETGAEFSHRTRLTARVAQWLGARFTSVSEQGRTMMTDQLGIPARSVVHLVNGVDLSRFHAVSPDARRLARESLGIPTQNWVIGIVGALKPVKGHDFLLEAVALARPTIQDLKLLIVGDGPLRGSLDEMARRLGLRECVEFVGWREDVAAVLPALDAFVCSSRSEGMSNSLLEAMACGLPVISTAVGDHPVLLRSGMDGLLVPPNDAKAMAMALETLYSPEKLADLASRARARAEEFDFARTVSEHQQFYSALCDKRPSGSGRFARICQSMSKPVTGAILPPTPARLPLE